MFSKLKTIIFFNIIAFSALSAAEKEPICCDPCATTLECPPNVCAYNAPLLLNPCSCWNSYATASFIYWRAAADYLDYAYLDNSSSPDPDSVLNLIFL